MKNVIQIAPKILGVIVPEKASDFEFIHDKTRIGYKVDYRLFKIELPKGNFKIHGICTLPAFDFDFEVDESWVQSIVFENNLFLGGKHNLFKDYTITNKSNEFCLLNAKDSFRTRIQNAIQDEGMFVVNPYKKPDNYELWEKYGSFTQYGESLTIHSLQWKSSESKTVKKLLLIEKI